MKLSLNKLETHIKEQGQAIMYAGGLGLAIANLIAWLHSWPAWLKWLVGCVLVLLMVATLVRLLRHDPVVEPPPPSPPPPPERLARCHTVIVGYCKSASGSGPLPNEITLTLSDKTLALREFWDPAFLLQVGALTMGGDLKIVTDKQGNLNCIRLENAWKHLG